MTNWGYTNPNVPRATMTPTARDIEWLIGFLEGEGSFGNGDGSRFLAEAVQRDPEPLLKVQRFLGGTVRFYPKNNNTYTWYATGSRARGIMMTLYGGMSQRRRAHQSHLYLGTKRTI